MVLNLWIFRRLKRNGLFIVRISGNLALVFTLLIILMSVQLIQLILLIDQLVLCLLLELLLEISNNSIALILHFDVLLMGLFVCLFVCQIGWNSMLFSYHSVCGVASTDQKPTDFESNEYVIYDKSQVRLLYLVCLLIFSLFIWFLYSYIHSLLYRLSLVWMAMIPI